MNFTSLEVLRRAGKHARPNMAFFGASYEYDVAGRTARTWLISLSTYADFAAAPMISKIISVRTMSLTSNFQLDSQESHFCNNKDGDA